jgi:hypothetical protein
LAMLALCECSLGKGSINTLTSLAILGHFPVSPDQHIITQYYSTAHSTHNTQHYSVSKLQIQQLSLGLMGRRHLVREHTMSRKCVQMLHFYLLQYRFEIWTRYPGGTGSRTSWSSGERDGASTFNASSLSYRGVSPRSLTSAHDVWICFRESLDCSLAGSSKGSMEVEVGKDTTRASHFSVILARRRVHKTCKHQLGH